MARELDSEMLRRLQEQYGEMSDGELVELAGEPDDLTDVALEVLRGEMAHRGLKAGAKADAKAEPGDMPEFGTKLPDGSVILITFNDAMTARNACDLLEDAGIDVNVRDVSEKDNTGGSFYGGSPVALQVIVPGDQRDPAVELLRDKMGLFPLQEVEEADELVDDGTVSAVGFFGNRADAEDVGRSLEQAGIWHRLVANEEGSVEDENAFSLEVKEVDLFEAGDVVEKALG